MKFSKRNVIIVVSAALNIILFLIVMRLLFIPSKKISTHDSADITIPQEEKKSARSEQQLVEESKQVTDNNQHTLNQSGSKDTKLPFDLDEPLNITYKPSYDKFLNENTVRNFKALRTKFKDVRSIEDLCNKVYADFLQHYSKEEADVLLKVFKAYLSCEFSMSSETSKWKVPNTADGLQGYIDNAFNFRKNRLGDKIAERLYGVEHHKLTFKVQKAIIAKNSELYGKEKEKMIDKLASDIWGNEYDKALHAESSRPYEVYKEKLALYKKDMSEMDDDQKKKMINQFKQELLSPKLIQNLEEAEKMTHQASQEGKAYLDAKQQILNDSNLSSEEKDKKVKALQEEVFGKNLEAFQRAESLSKKMKDSLDRGKSKMN